MYCILLQDLEETDQKEKMNCKICCGAWEGGAQESHCTLMCFMIPSKRFLCVNNVAEITQSKVNFFLQML